MSTEEIIREKLKFLEENYSFIFKHFNNSGDHYIYENKNGSIEFYEWEQFDESGFFVNYYMTSKKIDLFLEYPKQMGSFHQAHKGIRWLFKDARVDYWQTIAEIIKLEIERSGKIFGLNL